MKSRIHDLAQIFGRPICILDTETTGIGKRELTGIVDLGFVRCHPNGETEVVETLINPERSIDREASGVHHLYARDVKEAPKFSAYAQQMLEILQNDVISGFNTKSYDVPLLVCRVNDTLEAPGSDSIHHLDVRHVWKGIMKTPIGKLVDVAAHFGVQVDEAHRAMADVRTTSAILERMIEVHGLNYIADFLMAGNKVVKPKTKPLDLSSPQATQAARRAAPMAALPVPSREARVHGDTPDDTLLPAPDLDVFIVPEYYTKLKFRNEDGSVHIGRAVMASVARYVQRNKRLTARDHGDFVHIFNGHYKTNITALSLSIAINKMVNDNKDMEVCCFCDEENVQRIAPFVAEAFYATGAQMTAAGKPKLKPIREHLISVLDGNIDFIDVNAALSRLVEPLGCIMSPDQNDNDQTNRSVMSQG